MRRSGTNALELAQHLNRLVQGRQLLKETRIFDHRLSQR